MSMDYGIGFVGINRQLGESGNNQSDMSNSITNNDIESEKSEGVVIINYPIDLLPNYVEISIAWDDLADNEEGYFVQRRLIENENFTALNELDANSIAYLDTKARLDKAYCHRIGGIQHKRNCMFRCNLY